MQSASLLSMGTTVLLSAMAGGMGWGIRGQYGHETGAMIAGLLVSLVLVLRLCPRAAALPAARAVAIATIGISFGGSMTYAQTVGLTHDAPLIGNVAALRWGLLGLALKGGIWIGLFGALFGMALSGKRYRPLEWSLLLLVLVFVLFAGVTLFNEPFDPDQKILPRLYFSDHWDWEPDFDLEPRRERWGGLLAVLAGLVIYAGGVRRDSLAVCLAGWGFLGGALGFPLGQCIQAGHAWYPEWFQKGWFAELEPLINWWNMMETAFGAIFGAVFAVGVCLHRKWIEWDEHQEVALALPDECSLALVHVLAVAAWNFGSFSALDRFADLALTMGILPIVAVSAGRLWPYLLALPIVCLPIAGKTLRQLAFREDTISPSSGGLIYLVLPLLLATATAFWLFRRQQRGGTAHAFARIALLLTTWVYFWLNFAFFHYPWPWSPREDWTYRTPNGIIFAICAVGMTCAALFSRGHVETRDRAME